MEGSHHTLYGGRHTTVVNEDVATENSVTVSGIRDTDILHAQIESLAPSNDHAHVTVAPSGGSGSFDMQAIEPGPELNGVKFQFFDGGEDAEQVEDWNILIVDNAGDIAMSMHNKPDPALLTMADFIAALNAKASGTYGASAVVFSDPDNLLDPLSFSNPTGDFLVGASGEWELSGSSPVTVNLTEVFTDIDTLTFRFAEAIGAGHIISYIVYRNN